MPQSKYRVGLLCRNASDVVNSVVYARDHGYNFVCVDPVLNEEYVQGYLKGEEDVRSPFSWCDLSLSATDWSSTVVGILRDLNKEMEGQDELIADRARRLLLKEIEFTHHIAIQSMVVELKDGSNFINLARIVQSFAAAGTFSQQFCIKVPFGFATDDEKRNALEDSNEYRAKSSWHLWHKFRSLCNYEPKVCVGIEITVDLPSDDAIKRWMGEPVRCIFIPTNCFLSNAKGYPTLSKLHQQVVKTFIEIGAQVVIDPGNSELGTSFSAYRQYLDYLQSLEPAFVDEYSGIPFTSGYEDCLQVPLQPLQDNLESQTYEVFEKDPVKYDLYADAIQAALLDRVPEDQKESKIIVLMVVGAGRGPIVRSSFRAAEKAERKVKVYAIEKNTNAANTLLHLNIREWRNEVTVVNVDMRDWDAPEKADILVSELLGSFGDNELSPECLDGAQNFLKPDGIMIPQSYRSYLSPIMSSKLFNEVRHHRDIFRNLYSHFETMFVCHMKNRYMIAEPKLLFSFVHPKEDVKHSNERYKMIKFEAKEDCVLHGFAGYFECTLYRDTIMSILPKTFSHGMFSWFPVFIPIREPVEIQKRDDIHVHFWRCSRRTSVWYEWALSSPVPTPIHNPNGRSQTIGL